MVPKEVHTVALPAFETKAFARLGATKPLNLADRFRRVIVQTLDAEHRRLLADRLLDSPTDSKFQDLRLLLTGAHHAYIYLALVAAEERLVRPAVAVEVSP